MAIYVRDKLISSKTESFIITENETLKSLVARTGIPEVVNDYIRVSINGHVIEPEFWGEKYATTSDRVFIALVPQGSSDGKNPLAMVAMMALTVVSGGWGTLAAEAMLGAGTAGVGALGAAISTGIMFVGALLINAIFPPPTPKSLKGDDSAGFHGVDGQRNSARPYGAVRNIYGSYKVAPDLAAEPYIITTGDNVQTLYAIYDFGYGYVSLSDIRIGNTPLDDYSEVSYKEWQNYTNQDLVHYRNDNVTENFNIELTGPDEWTKRTTLTDDCTEIYLELSFPMGLGKHNDDGDFQSWQAPLEILYGNPTKGYKSIGEAFQVLFSHKDMIIYNQNSAKVMEMNNLYEEHVVNAGNGYPGIGSYSNIRIDPANKYSVTTSGPSYNDKRWGGPYEPPFIFIGQEFTIHGITYEITGLVDNGIRIVEISPIIYGDSESGMSDIPATIKEYNDWTITLDKAITQIPNIPYIPGRYYELIGEGTEWEYEQIVNIYKPNVFSNNISLTGESFQDFTVKGSTTKPFTMGINIIPENPEDFEEIYGIGNPVGDTWEIQIRRTNSPAYLVVYKDSWLDRVDFSALTAIKYTDPLNFPVPHTILELKIRATDQLNGVIDTLTAHAERVLPTVEPGGERVYTVTSNPAWVLLDLLRGDANPDPIPDSRIDWPSFAAFALFCSETAPNADEEYYQVAANWDAYSTVYERINEVLSSARATLTMVENKYSILYEKFPVDASQLFTPMNSWGFTGNKVFTKQPHGLKIQFIDPESDWQMTDFYVYYDGYDENNATYFEDLTLPLCTRSTQAWRDGRYYLAQGILRPEHFTIITDIENLVVNRGDLIELQHDIAKMGGLPSRISAISQEIGYTYITLTDPIVYGDDYVPGTYKCMFRRDNATMHEEVISDIAIDAYTFSVPTVDNTVKVGDLIVYGAFDEGTGQNVADEYLVKSIEPSTDLTATLTLIPIARAIDDADKGTIPDYVPSISDISMFTPIPVEGAKLIVRNYHKTRQPYIRIDAIWEDSGTNVTYDVYLSEVYDNNYIRIAQDMTDTRVTVLDRSTLETDYILDQHIYVKIIPKNYYGNAPEFDNIIPLTYRMTKDTTPPGKPLFFESSTNNDSLILNWVKPIDVDLAGYKIRYTAETENPKWEDAVSQGNLIPYNITSASMNLRVGTYMIKSMDTSTNYSTEAAMIRTSVSELSGFTGVTDIHEHETNFGGISTYIQKVGDPVESIELAKDGDQNYFEYGTYNFEGTLDLGGIYKTYITTKLKVKIINSIDPGQEIYIGDQDANIQVRLSAEDFAIANWDADFCSVDGCNMSGAKPIGDIADDAWSGWDNLTAGYYTGRYFAFRCILSTTKPDVAINIEELSVSLMLPARSESHNNIIAPIAGILIYYTSEFYVGNEQTSVGPTLLITHENASSGDYYVITERTSEKFRINFFNVLDEAIEAQFDYTAMGYGEANPSAINPSAADSEDSPSLFPEVTAHRNTRHIYE